MKKFKIFVDMDKEEKYLNDKAKNGFMLKNYSSFGVYTFMKAEPEDLNYRIDYRMFKSEMEFEQYKTLFQDAGWVHVSGTKYSGSQYFLPKSTNMDLCDIFSDVESKCARYKRLKKQSLSSFMIMLTYLIVIFSVYGFKLSNFGYLTPGLWEKNGSNFWSAFIFETPFVILRIVPCIFFMMCTIMYGYGSFKAKILYKKSLI